MWNKEEYNRFIDELYSYEDIKYRDFTKKLIPDTKYKLIGIRMDILKRYAKKISKTDYKSFIKLNNHNTYEEVMIHGLLIGYLKEDINEIITLYKDYIEYIDNWALCDSTTANLHIIDKHPIEGINFIKWCLNSKKIYYNRVGYVLLLNYYIKGEYLELIFESCDNNDLDDYYVKMAIAWLISICYIKYPKETLNYLEKNKLDDWTHNKTIQKIRESTKISKEEKNNILKWKR